MIRSAKDMKESAIVADIGGRLRQARQQRGLSLQDAARVTKLSLNVLRAIERNDFESLPRGIYRKGYLRSLAGEVGLDPEQIAADYDNEFERAAEAVAPADPTGGRDRQWLGQLAPSPRRSFVTLAISIVLAVAWFVWVAADSDGVRALYRLIMPGERVVLEGRRVIALRPGGDGEVIDLQLTPDNIEALRDGTVETASGD